MTGVALSYGFDDARITSHLAALIAADGSNFQGARREIGEFMLGEVQDNLDGQRLFDGSAMPQSKAAIKRRGKTLIKSHQLYDSYVYQLSDSGVAIGSAKVYAAIHHFGGDTGRGHKVKLPARPVLGMTERVERSLGDIMIAEIQGLQA